MFSDFMVGLLPLMAILMGIGAGVIAMYFRSRRHKEEQETIRLALEKGIELPENIFKQVERHSSGNGKDSLRRGLFWTFVGVALFIALWIHPEAGIQGAAWALIPIGIGLGSLVYHKLTKANNGNAGRPR